MRTGRYQPSDQPQTEAWQKEIRAKLTTLLGIDDLMASRPTLSFDVEEKTTWDVADSTASLLSLRSTPGRMMEAIVTVPKILNGRLPVVVCVGGHGSEIQTTYSNGEAFGPYPARTEEGSPAYKGFATELAKRGYITITTPVSQHEIYEPGRLLMAERLWDLMRCVDYLETLPFVDTSRIGCAGLSLGGEMAMWLGALDTRIAAEVSAGWLTMFDQLEVGHCMCWKFDGLRELVDLPDIFCLMAPRPILCQNGRREGAGSFTPERACEAMTQILPAYVTFGQPEGFGLYIHGGAHEVHLQSLLDFFEARL
jgi:hypothetical protein